MGIITVQRKEAGFTLVELLIAMVILGVVLTGVVRMFSNTGHYHTAQEMMVDLTQDLRAVKQLMVQELREAGCDPTNKGGFGFQIDSDDRYNTDDNSIHFTRDIDNGDNDEFLEPDGDANDGNEDVSYYRTNDDCSGSAGAVMTTVNLSAGCLRRNTGGGGQPLLPGVRQFKLQYWRYDSAQDKEILMPPPFSKGELEDVNTVQVSIEAQVDEPSKVNNNAETQTLDFRVLIRNG